jgi:hypothetical protein
LLLPVHRLGIDVDERKFVFARRRRNHACKEVLWHGHMQSCNEGGLLVAARRSKVLLLVWFKVEGEYLHRDQGSEGDKHSAVLCVGHAMKVS